MLETENCPIAVASYSTERMVLNQNRNTAFALQAPIGNIERCYDDNDRIRREQVRKNDLFIFASYLPLLLATRASDNDNSGVFVLVACCLLTFFLFGGRRSKKIKD
jgi:hypothetical protein